MDIPRVGPSNNPRDKLRPKKNISDVVVDEDYMRLLSSNLGDSDEVVIPGPRGRIEDIPMEEKLSLVVSR